MTEAYWSQYFVTASRERDGTLFTTPFMTDVGLGILTTPAEETELETFTLLFSPFSITMWVMTLVVCCFVASIVWLTEIIDAPSRKADKIVHGLTSTVYRKESETEIEERMLDDGEGKGVFDSAAYSRYPSYFLGTFSGLMNPQDDSNADSEEKLTPSGPFAAGIYHNCTHQSHHCYNNFQYHFIQ